MLSASNSLSHLYQLATAGLRNEFFPKDQVLVGALQHRDQLIRRLREQGGNEGMVHVLTIGRKAVVAEIRANTSTYNTTVSRMIGHSFPVGSFQARRDYLDTQFHVGLMAQGG